MLLKDALPDFSMELARLLLEAEEPVLADQIHSIPIVQRCRCNDDFCASFYTAPKPSGTYGPGHRCLELQPEKGMIILDLVGGQICKVEVLYCDDVKFALDSLRLPKARWGHCLPSAGY